MQTYAASDDFNAWRPHNVAAFSIVALCSVAYLGHVLAHKTEQARRERNAQIAQMELVEEAEAKRDCALCEKHKRASSNGSSVATTPASPPQGTVTGKKSKKDKKGKGPALQTVFAPPPATRDASTSTTTRSIAVQTDSEISLPRPYPPDEILAFSRVRQATSGSSLRMTDEDDDISDMGLAEQSFARSKQPVASTSRDVSLSSRSVSTAASDVSSMHMRRRSSSGATSLSLASTSAMSTLEDDQGFMTPPNSTKKSRRARQKDRELLSRKEVVGMPRAAPTRQASLPVPGVSVSRSNTLKAVPASESYWTQNPVLNAPAAPAVSARPMTRPSSAMSNRSGTSVKSAGKQLEHPLPVKPPDTRSSVDAGQEGYNPAAALSPPISPSPYRVHSNGGAGQQSVPPSPSPSFSGRPPSYAASSFDAIAAAQQAAYILAQQQAFMQQHQQMPRSPMGAYFPNHPIMQMPYLPHPNYGQAALMNGGPMPSLSNSGRRSSSLSLASDVAAAGSENKAEVDRLRDQLHRLREKSKRAEIENERKNKELEIARWRLQCVEVERKQEDRQTQEAICFFVERAESAEKRVKELEAKLGVPSEDTEAAKLTRDGSSDALQITPTNEMRSPRPSSPAALAGLERLEMSQAAPFPPSSSRISSPRLSPSRLPSHLGSPPYSPAQSSDGYRRRSTGKRHPSTIGRPRNHSAPHPVVDDSSDSDDLVILLHSPALEATQALGLGISGTSATSSDAGDEAEREAEEEEQTILLPAQLKVQPATPDAV